MKKVKFLIIFLICLGSLTSFSQITLPYSESFESGLGDWTQLTNDNFDWTLNSGTTPTADTGPTSAFDGSNYLYIESTGNNNPTKNAIIETEFDFTGNFMPIFSFNYHLYGVQVGTLSILANDGNGWVEIWNIFENQGDAWGNHKICLNNYANKSSVMFRIKASTLDDELSDIAIDKIEVVNFKIVSSIHTDVTCGGYDDGDINIVLSGGFSPYDYSINDGTNYYNDATTSYLFSGLSGADYPVRVRDNAGCVVAGSVVSVQEPPTPTLTIDKFDVQPCVDDNNGIILIVASGSNPSYSYSITGTGGTYFASNTFSNLSVGTYNIAVKTDIGCVIDGGEVEVEVPQAIIVTDIDVTDVYTCNGDSNGSIELSATGGNIQLDYSIDGSNYQLTGYFSGLTTGNYDIIIRDSEGCTETETNIFIDEPTLVEFESINSTDVTGCYQDDNGTITLIGKGGTGVYTYSKNGVVYQSESLFENLSANTYGVYCRDKNLCTASGGDVLIGQPDQLILDDIATVDVSSCFGASDGEIAITAHGGTGVLYYSIDNGNNFQTSNIFTGLAEGTYFPYIKDENDCFVAWGSVGLIQPTELKINVVNTLDVSTCYGESDGSIWISASNGTPPLQYSVNNGATYQASSSFLNSLPAGDYNIRVKDVNDCFVNYGYTVTISEPEQIVITDETVIPVVCYGENNGKINVSATGGTNSLYFSVDGGGSFAYPVSTSAYLYAGIYDVVVKDGNDCQTIGSTLEITQPDLLEFASIDITNIEGCYGDETASIVFNVIGGTTPYEYSLNYGNDLQNENSFTDLPAGTDYFPYVIDANECFILEDAITIIEPSLLYFSNTTHVDIEDCSGSATGSISIIASGGTPTLLYSVNGGTNYFDNGGEFTNLVAGTYTISIKDANDCVVSGGNETINQPASLIISSVDIYPVVCNNESNGMIKINAEGGNPQLRYSINGGDIFMLSSQFMYLTAGNYDLVVIDSYDCIATESVNLSEPPEFFIDEVVSSDVLTCYEDNSGSINISVSGGVTPYLYSYTKVGFETSPYQANPIFNGLYAGHYFIEVKDNNGCHKSQGDLLIEEPTEVNIQDYNYTHITCDGMFDGTINMQGEGGTGTHQYTIDNGDNWYDNGNFINLQEDTYYIGVRDENQCENEFFVPLPIDNPAQVEIINIYSSGVNCVGTTDGEIVFYASGGTGEYEYSINGVDFQSSNTFSNLGLGTYYPTVKDANSCTVQDEPITFVEPEDLSGFSVSTDEGCSPLEVTFYKDNEEITFLWRFSADSTSSYQVPTYSFENLSSVAMEFEVEVVAFHNICQDTAYQTITVYPSPDLFFHTDVNDLYYPDTTVFITNFTTNWDDYTWDFGDGQTSNETYPIQHSYSTCGEYIITLSADNDYACTGHFYDTVNVIAVQPSSSFFTDKTNGCVPLTLSFNNLSTYSNKYTWNFGEGTFSADENPIYTFHEAGTYKVMLDTEGDCATTSNSFKTIEVHPSPIADFMISAENDTVTVGQPVGFFDMSEAGQTFLWQFGDSTETREHNPQHTYDSPGSYNVTQYVTSEKGCTDSITIENAVLVIDDLVFTCPTAFTPNNDGINDFIEPSTNLVEESKIIIYNRYGQIVFTSNNPTNEFWDGTDANGRNCDMDIYVWVATGKYVGNSRIEEKGTITLIR